MRLDTDSSLLPDISCVLLLQRLWKPQGGAKIYSLYLQPNGQLLQWWSSDVNISRLKATARIETTSHSDILLSDWHIGMLLSSRLLPLGRLFPTEPELPQRRCSLCGHWKDPRLFASKRIIGDDGELIKWTMERVLCSSCKSSQGLRNIRQRKRDRATRVLLEYSQFTDGFCAKEADVGTGLIRRLRKELQDSGEILPAPIRSNGNGRLYYSKGGLVALSHDKAKKSLTELLRLSTKGLDNSLGMRTQQKH